jgi:uncharacterized protein YndB with AHSA1/START domain
MAGNTSALTVTLPSDREIVLTRVFDAPRALVFEAYTTPEHLRHWWGPRGHTLPICEMDFRPGGRYRMVSRDPDGNEFAFRGEYREIVPPERLVQTFEFEGMPGHIAVETLTMAEKDGRTTVTTRSVYDSPQDRDAVLQSGMERGAAETLDRLAEYLPTLR